MTSVAWFVGQRRGRSERHGFGLARAVVGTKPTFQFPGGAPCTPPRRYLFCFGEKVRNRCGELMGSVWVIWGEQWILDVTMDMAAETSENMNELDGLVTVSSRAVFRTGETQVRANQILTIILESAHEAVEQYFQTISQHSGPDSQHDPPEWLRQAAGLFEHVAAEFTRQATELKESLEKNPANSDSRVRIWWDLSEPMLERLLGEPHPWGLYLIMKGLKDLAPFSPGKSLHWLRRITETGTSRGLNFEHAAMDETIEILERFLANHWTTHGSEEVLDDLVHIVDICSAAHISIPAMRR